MELCSHKPRNTTRSWKRQGGFSPRAFRGTVTLPTLCFQTSGLQNCEYKFLLFKATMVAGTCYSSPRKLMVSVILCPSCNILSPFSFQQSRLPSHPGYSSGDCCAAARPGVCHVPSGFRTPVCLFEISHFVN